jgi:hypothetical protein
MLGDATKGNHEIYHDEVHCHAHYERKCDHNHCRAIQIIVASCPGMLVNYVGVSKFLAPAFTQLFDVILQ